MARLPEGGGSASHADVVRANGKPLISAIVPTHNRAGTLPDALRSIYAQQGAGVHFDVEIVVVDDASTDTTSDVIREHPAVRYIHLPVNRGASAARNAGIRASRGGYVAFLDDDDVWLPDKLLRQLRALEAQPEAAAAYSPYLIRFPGQAERPSVYDYDDAPSGSILHALLLRGNYCGSPIAVLARRGSLEAAGGFDEDMPTAEDYDLWLRLASRFPFVFVPGPVAIRERSLEGKYGRHLVAGDDRGSARYVVERRIVERALGLLADTEASGRIKREALAALEARIGSALCEFRLFDLMRAHLVTALHRTPWLVDFRGARSTVAHTWSRFALTADTPIPATRKFCDDLRHAARGHGMKHGAQTRRLLGAIWTELGTRLASAGRHKEAGYAAASALVENPLLIVRKTLPGVITQVGMGALRQARMLHRERSP